MIPFLFPWLRGRRAGRVILVRLVLARIVLAWTVGLTAFFCLPSAWADTIVLKNGRTIRAEATWEQDGQVFYTRYGQTIGIPLKSVLRVDRPAADGTGSGSAPDNGEPAGPIVSDAALDREYQALVDARRDLHHRRTQLGEAAFQRRQAALNDQAIEFARKARRCMRREK
jgi:hypothetical protein